MTGANALTYTLVQLATAFVAAHPAVTSAIIGPRTAGQLTGLLSASDVTLESAILDRIDQIVPPGISLNPADAVYGEATLADPASWRRPVADPKRP